MGRRETAEEREQRLRLQDDDIGRALREAAASGELARAPSWGKPLDFGDGYAQTPDEFRMPMKILKDAGVLPPEVQAMRDIAALQAELDAAAPDDPANPTRRQRLVEMRQALALRLERLRISGSL
jgi:hypothetical protein